MFKRTRPIFALTVAPLLLAMLNGCSGPSVEAAPLNVAAISGIKSYHVRINMTQSIPDADGHWITSKSTIDEDRVGRDRLRRTVVETENGKTTRSQVIVIGVNEWYKEDGEWMLFPVRVPAAGLNGMFVSTLLTSMDQLARFANLPTKGERLNGQRAVHYFARDGETGCMAAGGPVDGGCTGGQVVVAEDLWTTGDGTHPLRVKVEFREAGCDAAGQVTLKGLVSLFQADYSDINGSDIASEPPI